MLKLNPSNPAIWTPANKFDYSATLSFLSESDKRWKVTNTGKIVEVNSVAFHFEKFKGMIGLIDHTQKELVGYHILKLFAYGHHHDLLTQQKEKIQKIAERMGWSFSELNHVLDELSEKIKSPLQFKIDMLHTRLRQWIEREKAADVNSCERILKQWQGKFEFGLMSKKHFDKVQTLFQEERKDIEAKLNQAEEVLQRKKETEEYFTELYDCFDKCMTSYEDFFLKFKELINKNKLSVTHKAFRFKAQVILERGLLSYIKGHHPIDAYVESRISKGTYQRETLLHLACIQENLPLTRWLLNRGANPNVFNAEGSYPLLIASFKKCKEIPYLLIEKGANIHTTNPLGISQIFSSVITDNLDLLKFLANKGADLSKPNDFGNTPLMIAISRSKSEILKFLLESGAKTDDRVPFQGGKCTHAAYLAERPIGEISADEDLECREVKQRIFLANIWSVSGVTHMQESKISLEGGIGHVGIKEIKQLFSDFLNIVGKTPSFELINTILNQKSISWDTDPQECLRRFNAGETLLFDSGFVGHCISVIYHKDYLLILNRGGQAKNAAIFVQKIDRTKAHLRERHWKTVLVGSISPFAADRFFYKNLPALSGGLKNAPDPIADIFHNFLQNHQKIGNCWIVSPKLFPLALLLICELLQLKEQNPTPMPFLKSYFYRREQKKILKDSYSKMYKPFTTFMRLHGLKNYFLHILEAKEKSQKEVFEPDHQLIQTIMRKYYTKYLGRFSPYRELDHEIKQHYQKYLLAFDQKPVSTIGPTFSRVAKNFHPKLHLKKRLNRNVQSVRSCYKKLKKRFSPYLAHWANEVRSIADKIVKKD